MAYQPTTTMPLTNRRIKIYNPYKDRMRPNALRWHGSAIKRALPSALVCTALAVIVTATFEKSKLRLGIQSTLVPVLGFVVGLLLTYRTNTAYDRYWAARCTWSNMVTSIRGVSRAIWVNVHGDSTEDMLEKKTAINLLLGFAIATKLYLRHECNTGNEELKPFITNIQSRLPSPDQNVSEVTERISSESTRSPKPHKSHTKMQEGCDPNNYNIPLEISLYLSSYVRTSFDRKNIDAPTTTAMFNGINTMVDCLSTFERILYTPIPLAYSIHLSQTVWIYCLSLPFQFVALLHWVTIPMVFFCSLVLFGIEKIGGEIENPFGRDDNDLDLDHFCETLNDELAKVTSRPPPSIEEWVFNEFNHPFGLKGLSAKDARKLPEEDVRSLLSITEKAERSSADIIRQENPNESAPPELPTSLTVKVE
ncbi:hypothetical protein G9A89_009442 [Geosiphon pyriformis]|nr:hypothetical protein G9A89_009442 [Geosiphon pyriformis]